MKIIDLDSLRDGHNFRVEFVDSSAFHDNPNPSYRLIDVTTRDTVLALNRLKGQQKVSPVLRGVNLVLNNDQYVTVTPPKTGWVKGNSNYIVQVGFDSRYAAYQTRRVNYPADFEITLTRKGTGRSVVPEHGIFIAGAVEHRHQEPHGEQRPHPIRVQGSQRGLHVQRRRRALHRVGRFGGKDGTGLRQREVHLVGEPDPGHDDAASLQRPPQPGDVFRIVTTKPFRTGEYFSFTTVAPRFDPAQAKQELDKIAVVPNPYVGAASWEAATTSVGRGERKVFFIHLPQQCTIRIYTISGHLVQTIEHNGTFADGQEAWNLTSRDGMDIAFGIYVYHVDAPGIGTKIDRFAILK